jgi:hypothetical protein
VGVEGYGNDKGAVVRYGGWLGGLRGLRIGDWSFLPRPQKIKRKQQ